MPQHNQYLRFPDWIVSDALDSAYPYSYYSVPVLNKCTHARVYECTHACVYECTRACNLACRQAHTCLLPLSILISWASGSGPGFVERVVELGSGDVAVMAPRAEVKVCWQSAWCVARCARACEGDDASRWRNRRDGVSGIFQVQVIE